MSQYCCGCNPEYDREQMAKSIKAAFPNIQFFNTNTDSQADAAVIICGCSSACADRNDAVAPYGTMTVWNPESIDAVCDYLKSVWEITAEWRFI